MRDCTGDEGRSFETGSQVLASNRCKLLLSRAMMVSVAVNVGRISRRVRLREVSASEPLILVGLASVGGGSVLGKGSQSGPCRTSRAPLFPSSLIDSLGRSAPSE